MIKVITPFIKLLLFLLVAIVFLSFFSRIFILLTTRASIISIKSTLQSRVAIVFGAGLRRDGTPTIVLKDRIMTAVDLYKAESVEKILMTGDNRFSYYDEPTSMAKFAKENGIPQKDLVLDFAGHSTYDSCYRAKKIFGIDKAILITQSFHLPRAIFICKQLGVDALGVASDKRQYSTPSLLFWHLREIPASFAAILDVWFFKPLPILGEPEPIFRDEIHE